MATHSYNSILKLGDGVEGATTGWPSDLSDPTSGDASSGFTTIAEVKDIDGPSLSADDEEVTYHKSTGKDKEFIQGLRDKGEVSFPVNYKPAHSTHNSSTGLLADYWNGVNRRDFALVLASDPGDGSHVIFFQGYVKGFEPANPVAGVMESTITMKITGDICTP